MSTMMPEGFDAEGRPEYETFFNYNDNILNNIGTFATNELLGFDDFQRAFARGEDVSFWDRLKSVGAGVGELGSTAALFIPGGAAITAASKLPALGRFAPKAVPFIFPTTGIEKGALGASMGLGAASMAAPEDSALAQILGYGSGAALAGIPLAAFARGRRNLTTTRPGTRQSTFTDPKTGATETFDMATDVPLSAARRYNPFVSPRTGNVSRGRLGAGAALAALVGSGFMGMRGSDAPPVQPFVPTSTPITTQPTQPNQTILDIFRDGQRRQAQNLQEARGEALQGFGQADRDALERYLSSIDVIAEGQTAAARREYQDLYDRLAGDVAAAEAAGAEGAAAVNRRYRQAARRAMREGRNEQVRSGVGGMVPVSGAVSDIATGMRGQGADLASYLRNNAAVAARDAGFDAETSLEYGNAMANQFAQEMALLGEQQQFATDSRLAREQRDVRSQYDAMLADLENITIQGETDIALDAARRLEAQQGISGVSLLANPGASADIQGLWGVYSQILSGNIPEGTNPATIEAAQAIGNELNARYGELSLLAFADYIASIPGGPESLGAA